MSFSLLDFFCLPGLLLCSASVAGPFSAHGEGAVSKRPSFGFHWLWIGSQAHRHFLWMMRKKNESELNKDEETIFQRTVAVWI